MEKIQISEESPTTYNLFEQELGDETYKEMEETLKENKQEMDLLRQEFNEMKRYIMSTNSIDHNSEVGSTYSVDIFANQTDSS